MSQVSIRAALEQALATVAPTIQTVYEDEAYVPTDPTVPYQEVYLLPAEPENPTYGQGLTRELGILQVTLCYQAGVGTGDAAERAELIKALFYRGASFTSGGITVSIDRTPKVGPGSVDAGRYRLPVRIRYFSNIIS